MRLSQTWFKIFTGSYNYVSLKARQQITKYVPRNTLLKAANIILGSITIAVNIKSYKPYRETLYNEVIRIKIICTLKLKNALTYNGPEYIKTCYYT